MSGSSGGGYIPPERTKFDCDTSIINTTISSIDIAVLSKHKLGDILEVLINTNGALIVQDSNGETMGSILHPNTSDIINCIKQGAVYEAKILSINIPACRVEIRRI